ncbi:hypothetical protein HY450_00830 [Candidatus Pacearchaeota archaeon]|nr:hypothetical protein [Candidatus Pacearchaeota archaeon]
MEEQKEIRSGRNVYLYYWTIPVLIAFLIINYFSRNIKISALDLNLMISIVSFLFGFMITITFSMLLTRVSSLKEALSIETGRLISMYLLSKNLGKNFYEKIKERIDEYTIKTLRYYTNYEKSREANYGIYEDIKLMEIKTKNQEANANSFLYILGELQPSRERLEAITGRRIEWSIKLSNYILGIILIVLLFLNRGDSFTNLLFIMLSTVIIFIFLIIEDYDDLRIGDYTYNISNSEQIFDLIGKERYYPKYLLNRVKLEKERVYRIGFIDEKTKEEKIFSIQYNPKFNSRISTLARKFRKNELPNTGNT